MLPFLTFISKALLISRLLKNKPPLVHSALWATRHHASVYGGRISDITFT